MNRIYNFSAGPSMLPEPVLKTAASQMTDYFNSGQSVMEMSHRSTVFLNIINETEELLRSIMKIPKNYKVLFLQGGASSQFAMVPLNLMSKNKCADFVLTGQWSTKAYKEALRYLDANIVASSKDENFSYIPKLDPNSFNKNADYFHICLNNTIYGTKFNKLPKTGSVPLVADASSCILSEPIDVSKFGIIYAGAQKNMGIAGLTVVIIKEDLIGHANTFTPTMFNYKIHSDNNSMFNTPPCYSIYICKLILSWIKSKFGNLENVKYMNECKASIIYNFLDKSNLFKATAKKEDRSIMNIPFITPSETLNKKFIEEASKHNIINIKGHRSIGGMRASIYNAMPIEAIYALVCFMENFEKENS